MNSFMGFSGSEIFDGHQYYKGTEKDKVPFIGFFQFSSVDSFLAKELALTVFIANKNMVIMQVQHVLSFGTELASFLHYKT